MSQNPSSYVHFLADTSSVKIAFVSVFDVVIHSNKQTGP